eukprot:TCALIF_11975-PA protein Name:"Protein of unknown function" AED:0.05 eAED:0.05 QI:0/0/0/0.5/1/1/2/0/703
MATKDALSLLEPIEVEEPMDARAGIRFLQKKMSIKKRSITLQLKDLQSDLASSPKRSRTALRHKSAALKKVVSELRGIVDEALELEEDEEELIKLEEYFVREQSRALIIIGEVDEHIEERLDEASTSFHSGQTALEQYRDQERNRIRSELEKIQAQARITKELEGELNSKLEQLDLGERAQDFDEYEATLKNPPLGVSRRPKTTFNPTEWMESTLSNNLPNTFHAPSPSRSSIRSEVPVFDGNPLNFMNWANMFESLVHNTHCSVAEKMGLLRASLGHVCLKLIDGFTNSPADYGEALKLILHRYGDPQELRRAHLQALRDIPRVRDGDPKNFPSFADGIQGHLRVVIRLLPRGDGLLTVLMDELSHKMDREHFFHWDNFAKDLEEDEKIHAFGDWAMERARRDRYFQSDVSEGTRNRNKLKAQVNGIESKPVDRSKPCQICRGMHKEKNCEKFKIAPTPKKREMARNFGLCYLCLESDHYSSICPHINTWSCRKDGCGGSHHSWLHMEKDNTKEVGPSPKKNDSSVQLNSVHRNGCLGVIPVLCSFNNREFMVNALVDEGSDTSVVSESLVTKLGIRRPKKTAVRLNLVSKEVDQHLSSVKFDIRGPLSHDRSSFQALVLTQVCPNLKPLSWNKKKNELAHLEDLPLMECDQQVDVLIGLDHGDLLVPLEVRKGGPEEPYAMRYVTRSGDEKGGENVEMEME